MARYCYDLSAYLEHDRSETQILEKSKPKILIRKR